MSDVTLPADEARTLAEFLRNTDGVTPGVTAMCARWADLLDPRPVSLRDEVAAALLNEPQAWPRGDDAFLSRLYADTALAVVRRRIEALPPTRVDNVGGLTLRHQVLGLFDEVTP